MSGIIINISPPKCGTTSLYFALVASDDVAQSTLKEPRFFAGESQGGDGDLPDAMRTGGNYANGPDWHEALFEGQPDVRYRIDFTTYYAITPDTPALLQRHYDDVRAIMVLRDPVKRFVSQYYQYRKMGISLPPIAEVIAGKGPIADLMYRFSDYRATYDRYVEAFGKDAVLVLDFDDLKSDPAKISAACNAFLGTHDIHYAPSERDKNVAGRPRFGAVQRLIFSDGVRRALRSISPDLKMRLLRWRKKIVLANTKAEAYPALSESEQQALAERLSSQTEFYRSFFGPKAG